MRAFQHLAHAQRHDRRAQRDRGVMAAFFQCGADEGVDGKMGDGHRHLIVAKRQQLGFLQSEVRCLRHAFRTPPQHDAFVHGHFKLLRRF